MNHEIDRVGSNPISLPEARNYCKVEGFTEDDALIGIMIDSAVVYAEKYTNKQVNTELNIVSTFDDLRDDHEYKLYLLYPGSSISVSSLTYTDEDGDVTTITTDGYWQDRNVLRVKKCFYKKGYFTATYTSTITELKAKKFKLPILKAIGDAYVRRTESSESEFLETVNMGLNTYLHQFQNGSEWL